MCCKWRGCKASPYGTLFLWCPRPARAGQVQRSLRAIGPRSKCVVSRGDLQGCPPSLPHGTSFQCSTRSAGQVRRSLLSVGPLLYKCSMGSLAWLCVLSLYWVATRRISSIILGMWRSLLSSWLMTYQGEFTIVLKSFDWKRESFLI